MKISHTYKNVFILLVVVGSFFLITKTLAINNPYSAGETRDPDCAPGDLFCTVRLDKNLYKENADAVATNTVSGENVVTIGSNNTASGSHSIAIGQGDGVDVLGATASGDYAISLGSNSTASGDFSTAIGAIANASGDNSVALGVGTLAKSFREVVVGSYPADYTPSNAASWVGSDRIFTVGNGSTSGSRSNALTIFKDGVVNIGGTTKTLGAALFMGDTTGAAVIPRGTTAQRPSVSGTTGAIGAGGLRYNTSTGGLEYSNASTWVAIPTSSDSGSPYYLYSENYPTGHDDKPQTAGSFAMTLGLGNVARTYGETVMGLYAHSYDSGDAESYDINDPLFTIGRGLEDRGLFNPANALIINKAGTIGLGDVQVTDLATAKGNDVFLTTETGAYLSSDGFWTDASDESLKTNIANLSYGLDEVNDLRPRSFEYIKTGNPSIGFIAQEVEDIIPEVVSNSGMGTKGLNYGQLTAVLVAAVQELSDRVEELEAQTGIEASVEENTPSEEPPTEEEPPVEEPPAEGGEGSQQASIIKASNDLNLTNLLLLLASILLIANIAVVSRRYSHHD